MISRKKIQTLRMDAHNHKNGFYAYIRVNEEVLRLLELQNIKMRSVRDLALKVEADLSCYTKAKMITELLHLTNEEIE